RHGPVARRLPGRHGRSRARGRGRSGDVAAASVQGPARRGGARGVARGASRRRGAAPRVARGREGLTQPAAYGRGRPATTGRTDVSAETSNWDRARQEAKEGASGDWFRLKSG